MIVRLKILSVSILLLVGIISGFVSCTGKDRTLKETATRGDIRISVDESYTMLMDAEIVPFMALYSSAKITPDYKPEYDVISDFMNDSVQVVVSSTKLTGDQEAYLKARSYVVHTVTFAYDALAIILNRNNPDTLLTYTNIRDIFLGKVTRWKEIDPASQLGEISVVFDNTKSGNVRYFKDKFEVPGDLPDNFYALHNNPEVIDYISRNINSLGVLSVNWISDRDDSLSMSFINKIRVAAISHPYMDQSEYYRPYQGSIYDKSYPFTREVFLLSRETFTGLGSGFIAWVTSSQGQTIVLKSGLVPATMPVRLVQVSNE